MEAPMLCASAPASGTSSGAPGTLLAAPGWIYELKLDGVRIVADKRGADVRLTYRTGRDATASYPEIAHAVAGLPARDAVLDGEIVAFDPEGKPSFQRLEQRIGLGRPRDVAAAAREVPVAYIAFDLIGLEDRDLRELPLLERRRDLRGILPDEGVVRCLDWLEDDGTALFDMCRRERLEGVIAKRASSRYASGRRSDDWVKIKCQSDDDFVVVGFTRGTGGRGALGALDVASYEEGELVLRGKVGSGLGDKDTRALVAALGERAERAPTARGEYVPAPRGRTHVRPELVVSVRYSSWTDGGHLRHPVFRGVRHDVLPEDCRAAPPRAAGSAASPELGEYWAAVGAAILPYLAGRSAIADGASLAASLPPLRIATRGWLVLDADAQGALAAAGLFRDIALPAFAKTGDAADYHVVVAVGDAPEAGKLALAELAARLAGGGALRVASSPILAPYSPVAGAGSRVSAPVAWEEVVPALDPRRLTTRTVAARVARGGDPMAPLLAARVDFAAAVARLEARLSGARGA